VAVWHIFAHSESSLNKFARVLSSGSLRHIVKHSEQPCAQRLQAFMQAWFKLREFVTTPMRSSSEFFFSLPRLSFTYSIESTFQVYRLLPVTSDIKPFSYTVLCTKQAILSSGISAEAPVAALTFLLFLDLLVFAVLYG
jgi:hypothetical protein